MQARLGGGAWGDACGGAALPLSAPWHDRAWAARSVPVRMLLRPVLQQVLGAGGNAEGRALRQKRQRVLRGPKINTTTTSIPP